MFDKMTRKIPTIETSPVFHVGTMKLGHKGAFFQDSLEGHCLSVSHCPEAWVEIAELGGEPLWELSKPGAIFLDVHKISECDQLRKEIERWGFDNNYVERKMLWRSWMTDEDGGWRYMLMKTKQEALDQAEGQDDGPDGNAVESIEVLVGLARLAEHVGIADLGGRDSFDFLAMAWAEATQPAIDGVWWMDKYAPYALSAPRGGIFPSKLSRWLSLEASFPHKDDCCGRGLKRGFLQTENTEIKQKQTKKLK